MDIIKHIVHHHYYFLSVAKKHAMINNLYIKKKVQWIKQCNQNNKKINHI